MKKILLAVLMIALLVGCTNNDNHEKNADAVSLSEYKAMVALDNRDDLIIYYDFDGVFDKATVAGLVTFELKEYEAEDGFEMNGQSVEEIEVATNDYLLKIIKASEPFFDYEYVEDENIAVNENDIRFILKNDDIQFNVYLDGYAKLISEESTKYYKCDDASFNKSIDNLYKELAALNAYLDDLRK